MKQDQFVNLHLHTEYSLLDGACRIKDIFPRLKELGQTACAITDHGNMYGAVEFWLEARKYDIKPIIGCEVYVAPRTRHDRESRLDSSPYHLILLCENNEGYRNLVKLVSLASIEGFYSKPRVDRELLERYSSGLICLSACLAGEIPRYLLNGQYDAAKECALYYQSVFGKGNYFIEVQDHGIDDERRILPLLYRLSVDTGIPLAATNDCHYISSADANVQEVLMCIQTGKRLGDPDAMSFGSKEFYIKSADEMDALFRGHTEAVANTAKIAERCNVEFEFGDIKLPHFTAEGVTDNESYFRELCHKGMILRYGSEPSSEVRERMEYELSVITKMGYTDYFLIVWDFIRYAREHGVPVGPGRGSGAGSLCAYCIGITGIDPMRYGLLFERFLNPERVSMPDFDIDFCIEGRQSVKDYVVRKYGEDRVSEIIAFDTLKARAAVRDAGRVMDVPYQLCDRIAKLIEQGSTLSEAMKFSDELQSLCRDDRKVRRLMDTAMKIEGMPRHTSTHAAGVVISAIPLSDLVPLQRSDETIITQYTMGTLEALGLLKMDFLGLRNLTVIRDTVSEIRRIEPDFNIGNIPLDDGGVYEMLSGGDTGGVFQFESAGMTQKLMELRPERLEDLIVVLSLYRPGPMKSIPVYIENKKHPESIVYKHPLLEPILSETYGVMVYQEQVMEICRRLAGYSYGHADIVRRAMAKKKHDVMLKERESFISGAVGNGVPKETADQIFDEMVSFASYAFNKSHAAAYAYLAYQTAYLKYHYKGQYMAALMSSVMTSSDKLAEYIELCRSSGIEVLRPDINRSMKGFTYFEGKIYFGLMAIRNAGSGLAERIIAEREKSGRFSGLQSFCERLEGRELNKKALESMIKAGAFDGLGLNRRQMLENYETILESAGSDSRGVIEGQLGLLGGIESEAMGIRIPDRPEFDFKRLLSMEKEAAGIYLSGSPLTEYSYISALMHTRRISSVTAEPKDGERVKLLCMLQDKKLHTTKRGEKMGFVTLSDDTGELETVIFPDLFAVCAERLRAESVLLVTGKVSVKDSTVSLVCESIFDERSFERMMNGMKLCIKTESAKAGVTQRLAELCRNNRGETQICFYLTDRRKTVLPKVRLSVEITPQLYDELCRLYGAAQIGLIQ